MRRFTSIRVSHETKQKLDLCKGLNNYTYDRIIEKLLEQSGGAIVEDTIEIQREQVAFSLKYWNEEISVTKDITYSDLAKSSVGEVFKAVDVPEGDNWVNSSAEVLVKKSDDMVLLVQENSFNGTYSSIKSIVHIVLF